MSKDTTPAVYTPKTLRFYSNEENRALTPFIKGEMKPSLKNLKDFCEKYNRSIGSVQVRIYTQIRKNTKKKNLIKGDIVPKVALTSVKDKTTVNMSKGEFKIPITNWNVSNENGQFYFVVKF